MGEGRLSGGRRRAVMRYPYGKATMHLRGFIHKTDENGSATKLYEVSTCRPFGNEGLRPYETCIFDELTGESEVTAITHSQHDAEVMHYAAVSALRFALEPHGRLSRMD